VRQSKHPDPVNTAVKVPVKVLSPTNMPVSV